MGNKILSILSPLCTLQINWEHKTAGRDDDVGLVMKWKINRSRRRKVVRQQNTNTQSRDGSLKDWICAESVSLYWLCTRKDEKALLTQSQSHTQAHSPFTVAATKLYYYYMKFNFSVFANFPHRPSPPFSPSSGPGFIHSLSSSLCVGWLAGWHVYDLH